MSKAMRPTDTLANAIHVVQLATRELPFDGRPHHRLLITGKRKRHG